MIYHLTVQAQSVYVDSNTGDNKNCTMTAKSAPYPPFPAEWNLLLKYLDSWSAGIASGNTTSPYCRAVSKNGTERLASHREKLINT